MRFASSGWLGVLALLIWTSALEAQPSSTESPAPDNGTLPESGSVESETLSSLTDVESLLRLRDAEKEFDEALTEALMPESTRIVPKYNPEKMDRLRTSASGLLGEIDRILTSEKTSTLRKEQTKGKKLSFLYEASRFDPDTYGPPLKQFLEELFVAARQEQGEERRLSALLTAYRLKEEFIDTNKPPERVQDALSGFRLEFPRSTLGELLYLARAENLLEIGDRAGAIEIYKRMKEEFPGDPRLAIVDSIVARIELVGQVADISGPTLDGAEINIADLKGKVILVDFWASWCGPCLDSFGYLNTLYEKYHDRGFEIIGVSLDDVREDAQNAITRYPAPWPHIFYEPVEGQGRGFANPLASKLRVDYVPALYLIGPDGTYIETNFSRLNRLEPLIVNALNLSPGAPSADKETTPEAKSESKPADSASP